jgi:SNF2 family DNA or RNA helicase
MGLGKTVQCVTFLSFLVNEIKSAGPFLVVAPLSTLPHWQREFEAWTSTDVCLDVYHHLFSHDDRSYTLVLLWRSDMNAVVYHGDVAARDLIYRHEFFFEDHRGRQVSILFTSFHLFYSLFLPRIIPLRFVNLEPVRAFI